MAPRPSRTQRAPVAAGALVVSCRYHRSFPNGLKDPAAWAAFSEEAGLTILDRLQPEFSVAQLRRDAALGRALEVAFHDQIRLIDFLERVRLLAHRDGQRTYAHGPSPKLHDDRFENALVHLAKTVLVNLQHG